MQTFVKQKLVLLALDLYLGLAVTELLEKLQLLLFSQILREQHLRLLPEKLHLRHLIQFLHLVESLKLHECMDLLGIVRILLVREVVLLLAPLFMQKLLQKPVILGLPRVMLV